jgi:hypothetical protein
MSAVTTIAGPDAVYLKLSQTLLEKFQGQGIELFTAFGLTHFSYALCVSNLARLLTEFYVANGRAPNLLFNSGVPPSLESELKARPDFEAGAVTWKTIEWETGINQETGQVQTLSIGIPVFNVRVYTYGADIETVSYSGESQTPTYSTVLVQGAFNRRGDIPLSAIVGGAASNWIILLVAASNPELLAVTDEGIMLLPGGVAMVEKSLAYWAEQFMLSKGIAFQYGYGEYFEAGPVLVGFPPAMLEKFHEIYVRDMAHGWRDFALMIISFVASAFSLYAGVNALGGLMNGVMSLGNVSGALSMADKFGIETSKVTAALNLASLTSEYLPVNNGGTMGEDGIFDFSTFDPDFIDPTSIDWGMDFDPFAGMEVEIAQDVMSGDFARLDRALIPVMDTGGTGDFARLDRLGTITLAETEMFSPFEVKLYADGTKTPEFQAAAMTQASQRIAERATSSGLSLSASDITKFASDALKIAGQFYTLQTQAQIAQQRSRMMLPGGATMQTLANGTRTLTYPDGRVVTIPAAGTGSIIPGIPNQYLMYGALAFAGLAAVSILRR